MVFKMVCYCLNFFEIPVNYFQNNLKLQWQLSLLIGLIFVGNVFGQLFENPGISNEDDLMVCD